MMMSGGTTVLSAAGDAATVRRGGIAGVAGGGAVRDLFTIAFDGVGDVESDVESGPAAVGAMVHHGGCLGGAVATIANWEAEVAIGKATVAIADGGCASTESLRTAVNTGGQVVLGPHGGPTLADGDADRVPCGGMAIGTTVEAGRQHDRAMYANACGDAFVRQGKLAEALESYRQSLAIVDRLAAADPDHAGWPRDLSVLLNRIGMVLSAQGEPDEALQSHRASLAIIDRLAAADPRNADRQRDLSWTYNKIADVLLAQGDPSAAIESYRAALAVLERLAAAHPDHVPSQWEVVACHWKLALLGDDPSRRFALAVATLQTLRAQGKLAVNQVRMLLLAQQRLAELTKP